MHERHAAFAPQARARCAGILRLISFLEIKCGHIIAERPPAHATSVYTAPSEYQPRAFSLRLHSQLQAIPPVEMGLPCHATADYFMISSLVERPAWQDDDSSLFRGFASLIPVSPGPASFTSARRAFLARSAVISPAPRWPAIAMPAPMTMAAAAVAMQTPGAMLSPKHGFRRENAGQRQASPSQRGGRGRRGAVAGYRHFSKLAARKPAGAINASTAAGGPSATN